MGEIKCFNADVNAGAVMNTLTNGWSVQTAEAVNIKTKTT
jgi:hypothetical protein